MVKLNSTLPANYSRSLRNRSIQNENCIVKKAKRGRGRPQKLKTRAATEVLEAVLSSPPDADKQLAVSVGTEYNHSRELLRSKSKHLKGWHCLLKYFMQLVHSLCNSFCSLGDCHASQSSIDKQWSVYACIGSGDSSKVLGGGGVLGDQYLHGCASLCTKS